MNPLHQELARLIGQSLARRWMKVIEKKKQQQPESDPVVEGARSTRQKCPRPQGDSNGRMKR